MVEVNVLNYLEKECVTWANVSVTIDRLVIPGLPHSVKVRT